jgi:hypothetical protein
MDITARPRGFAAGEYRCLEQGRRALTPTVQARRLTFPEAAHATGVAVKLRPKRATMCSVYQKMSSVGAEMRASALERLSATMTYMTYACGASAIRGS